jgi:hypothetical protein
MKNNYIQLAPLRRKLAREGKVKSPVPKPDMAWSSNQEIRILCQSLGGLEGDTKRVGMKPAWIIILTLVRILTLALCLAKCF